MTVKDGIQNSLALAGLGCLLLIILIVVQFFSDDSGAQGLGGYTSPERDAEMHKIEFVAYGLGGALIVIGCAGIGLFYYAAKPKSENRVLRFIQFLTQQAANLPEEENVSSTPLQAIPEEIDLQKPSKPSKEEKQFKRYERQRRFDIKEKVFESLEAATELEIQNRIVYRRLVKQIDRNPDLDDDEKDELIQNLMERYNKQREKLGLSIFKDE